MSHVKYGLKPQCKPSTIVRWTLKYDLHRNLKTVHFKGTFLTIDSNMEVCKYRTPNNSEQGYVQDPLKVIGNAILAYTLL